MARSVLLQLARDSIVEVYEAKNSIDKKALILEHPLLNEPIPTTINIYLENELRGSCVTSDSNSLLYNIIIGAKKAVFEDKNFSPLTTSEYLHCEIELILSTQDGDMSEKDAPIIKATP